MRKDLSQSVQGKGLHLASHWENLLSSSQNTMINLADYFSHKNPYRVSENEVREFAKKNNYPFNDKTYSEIRMLYQLTKDYENTRNLSNSVETLDKTDIVALLQFASDFVVGKYDLNQAILKRKYLKSSRAHLKSIKKLSISSQLSENP